MNTLCFIMLAILCCIDESWEVKNVKPQKFRVPKIGKMDATASCSQICKDLQNPASCTWKCVVGPPGMHYKPKSTPDKKFTVKVHEKKTTKVSTVEDKTTKITVEAKSTTEMSTTTPSENTISTTITTTTDDYA